MFAAALGTSFSFALRGSDVYVGPLPDLARIARASAAVITVSDHLRCYAAEHLGLPLERMTTVYNGVDTSFFSPAPAPASGADETVRLVCVANLVPVKGHDLLLEALAELGKIAPGNAWRLDLIGDGPEKDALRALADRSGIGSHIQWHGHRDSAFVRDHLRAADAFVLASRSEGLPVALMEAAACELPVVAPRLHGIPEVVVDGETGLLFERGQPADLARALGELLRSPRKRRALGEAGRRRVLDHFSLEKHLDAAERFFEGIVSKGFRAR